MCSVSMRPPASLSKSRRIRLLEDVFLVPRRDPGPESFGGVRTRILWRGRGSNQSGLVRDQERAVNEKRSVGGSEVSPRAEVSRSTRRFFEKPGLWTRPMYGSKVTIMESP